MPEQSASPQSLLEDRWTDNHRDHALICFRTDPNSHPLASMGLIKLNVSNPGDPVERFNLIAQEDPAPFFSENFSVSAHELESTVRQLQSNCSDSSTVKDSQTIERQVKPLLENTDFIRTLTDHLENDELDELVETLVEPLKKEVFSDPTAVFEIYVGGYEKTESPQEPETEEESTDGHLNVQPEIKPSGGTPILNLDPNDIFEVRIVGRDVKQLKPKYQDVVDGPNSKSIPLSAELKELHADDDSLLTFIVNLGKQLIGKGQTSPDSRVNHLNPKTAESNPIDYLGLSLMAVIGLLVSLAILVLLYPGTLYSLFTASGGL